jgi:hypothetical protein
MGAEQAIMTACQNLKAFLDTAATFDGREVLFDFESGEPEPVAIAASPDPAPILQQPQPIAAQPPPAIEQQAYQPAYLPPPDTSDDDQDVEREPHEGKSFTQRFDELIAQENAGRNALIILIGGITLLVGAFSLVPRTSDATVVLNPAANFDIHSFCANTTSVCAGYLPTCEETETQADGTKVCRVYVLPVTMPECANNPTCKLPPDSGCLVSLRDASGNNACLVLEH